MSIKILIVSHLYPGRAPNQRYRYEQYIDYLNKNGFEVEVSYLINKNDDKVFYKPGHLIQKSFILLKSFLHRWRDVRRTKKYDIIFIVREAFILGSSYFEKQFKAKGGKLVFDFDDAIWLPNVSEANKKFSFLKNSNKTSEIIKVSNMIFAGNPYLADYAKKFNSNVKIIPSTIDTDKYKAIKKPTSEICIGWSGSPTTLKHFMLIVPLFIKLKEKYGDIIYFKTIGIPEFQNEQLNFKAIKWSAETEVEDLNELNIGVMPLPDDEWSKGKCGMKGLQYMALNIPTIMSAVGVNTEIIENGMNGFLAKTIDDFYEPLCKLIESEELRIKIGNEGRKTVEEKYSFNAQKDVYVKYLKELAAMPD